MTDEEIGGIAVLAWYATVNCGLAFLFHRVGRAAWKAFVPVLNAVEVCRMAGVSGLWILTVFVPMVNLFAPLFICLKLCDRFKVKFRWGILVWLSAGTLFPLFALVSHQNSRLASPAGLGLDSTTSTGTEETTVDASFIRPDTESESNLPSNHVARHASFLTMTVLTFAYILALFCLPGLMIVGTMAFGGASQEQVDNAGIVVFFLAMTPVSTLIALIGGWVLHSRGKYSLAPSLVVLPIVNAVTLFVSFVWVLS